MTDGQYNDSLTKLQTTHRSNDNQAMSIHSIHNHPEICTGPPRGERYEQSEKARSGRRLNTLTTVKYQIGNHGPGRLVVAFPCMSLCWVS